MLGLSRIAKRRVLPALAALPQIEVVDVASRSSRTVIAVPERLRGHLYSDYEEALTASRADLVYVTLVNSLHVQWVKRALELGCHVLVDKPCAPTLSEAEALVELARRRGRCLAEAMVFTCHPQVDACIELVREVQRDTLRVSATFSFPPMDATDFRYYSSTAGGSLHDLGPYAAATARLMFGAAPVDVFCRVLSRQHDVDSAFAVMMTFAGGGALVGRFGFDTEYHNHLSVLGPGISFELSRIYTIPADMENQIVVKRNNVEGRIGTPAADSFLLFLRRALDAVSSGDNECFARDLLEDAELRERMRHAAGEI